MGRISPSLAGVARTAAEENQACQSTADQTSNQVLDRAIGLIVKGNNVTFIAQCQYTNACVDLKEAIEARMRPNEVHIRQEIWTDVINRYHALEGS